MSEEMNDQMQVRRQKLQELIDLGIDPFGHRFDRSSTCLLYTSPSPRD